MQFSLGERDVKNGSAVGERQGQAGQGGGQQLLGGAWPGEKQKPSRTDIAQMGEPIPADIKAALKLFAEKFHYPTSKDCVIRKFLVRTQPPTRAFVIYYEGLADTRRIEREILRPLTAGLRLPRARLEAHVINELIPAATVERKHTVEEVIVGVTRGEVAVVLERGCAILVDVKGPPSRQPSRPVSDRTILGSQMGFVESFRANTAMIRNFIHDPDFVLEQFAVGRRTMTPVAVMYLADIANPKLLAEVRRRIESLDVDAVLDTADLEAFIEDHPMSLVPVILTSERPDRTAYEILLGKVAIIVGSGTRALIVPTTYAQFLQSAEDVYLRGIYASFLRLIRLGALAVATLLPASFVAIMNYHHEMIPEKLLIVVAGFRAAIPFPLIVNLVGLELTFELIREAGLRIPSAIGPTIGIVGALLLGDMAVRSGLVTPMVVIIVAVTALASFTIPDPEAGFASRILRFAFLGAASVLGFYGITLAFFLLAAHLASIRSFGVPFLSPIAPWRAGSLDVILRGLHWKQEKRPVEVRPLDLIRQVRYVRAWDPGLPGATQAPSPDSDEERPVPEAKGGRKKRGPTKGEAGKDSPRRPR